MYLEDIPKLEEFRPDIPCYPKVHYPVHPGYPRIIATEIAHFLHDPANDELFWQLFKKFVLKK